MQTYQRVSITHQQSRERWREIVAALVTHGIDPDEVTFAALSLGAESLALSLGIEKAKRTIGFAKERR